MEKQALFLASERASATWHSVITMAHSIGRIIIFVITRKARVLNLDSWAKIQMTRQTASPSLAAPKTPITHFDPFWYVRILLSAGHQVPVPSAQMRRGMLRTFGLSDARFAGTSLFFLFFQVSRQVGGLNWWFGFRFEPQVLVNGTPPFHQTANPNHQSES